MTAIPFVSLAKGKRCFSNGPQIKIKHEKVYLDVKTMLFVNVISVYKDSLHVDNFIFEWVKINMNEN